MKNSKILIQSIFLAILITFAFNSCKKDQEDEPTNPYINFAGALLDPSPRTDWFELPSGGGTSIPPVHDFSGLMPSVRFQGSQGSCVAFALSALKSYHEKIQFGYDYSDNSKIMSPAFIYNQIKLPGNCAQGSVTSDGLNFLISKGVSNEAEFEYQMNDCSRQPEQTIKQNALKNKLKSWVPIKLNGSTVLDDIKYNISQDRPVVIDFRVDLELCKNEPFPWGDNIWKENNSGDPYNEYGVRAAAFHCALLVGYDDSKKAFKMYNSWGTWWKNEQGYCWIDYSWFLRRTRYSMVTTDNLGGVSGSEISITGTCPAEVQVGQSQAFNMTIHNNGSTTLNVSDLKINNNSAGAFSFTGGKPSLPITIPASGSKDVSLTFAPSTTSIYNATFEVVSNASSGDNTSPLAGSGTNNSSQTKAIRLTKTTCSDAQVNQSSNFTLTVHNDGNTSFTVNGITSSNAAFSVQSFSTQTVTAGSSVNYTMKFSPTVVQSYTTTLTVNSTATTGTNTVSVTANGLSGGGGVTVTPGVGTYTDCNYGSVTRTLSLNGWSTSTFTTNNYKIKVKSYDQNTGDIIFSVKRCNGQNIQELISVSIYDMNPNVTDGPTIESGFAGDTEVTLTRNISFAGSDTKQFIAIIETMGSWTDPNYCTQAITISW